MVKETQLQLSNVQMKLLKLYTVGIDEQILKDLKKEMAKFFLKKLRQEADSVWIEKGYSDDFF